MEGKELQGLVKKVNTMDRQSNNKEQVKEVQVKAREKHQDKGREVER